LAKGYKKTVYIGDGFSDRHISEKVDILFAKSALAEYCNSKGIKFFPFETFNDVINKLKTII
jgi:2-hydroxy-3-keto-5-methylthiopentenyl-1-phosphate phosphatase